MDQRGTSASIPLVRPGEEPPGTISQPRAAGLDENALSRSTADDWGGRGQDAIMRIPVSVRIMLGTARMPVSRLMSLTRGSVIPLDRKVGEMVDIVVNDQTVARGEVVVVDADQDGGRFAVVIREVVAPG